MIIRSLTRTGKANYKQLIKYVLKFDHPHKKVPDHLVFTDNMICRNVDIEQWVSEFEEQESMRLHKREDNVLLHHYILSFSDKDEKNIPQEMFGDIAYTFYSMLPESKYIGGWHRDDTNCLHLHVAGSGVTNEALANRLSKQEFASVQRKMQDHHLQHWYEYSKHSEVNFQEPTKRLEKHNEYFIKKAGKQSKRELLKENLEQLFQESSSKADFINRIEKAGVKTYVRGKNTGIIIEGRKWRLTSLGFTDDRFNLLEQNQKQIEELKRLRQKGNDKEIESIYYDRDTFKR